MANTAVANVDFDFVCAERTEFKSVRLEALALGMGRVGVYGHVFVQKENCEYAFVGRRPLDNSSSMEGMDSNIGNAMNGH